jgi:hypothetical protein
VSASRDALPILLLACACGASLRTAPLDPGEGRGAAAGAAPKAASGAYDGHERGDDEPDPRADALRARGDAVAPGMRLAAQRTSKEAEVDLLHAEGHDECVRVAFDASESIAAELTNGKGEVLARTGEAATAGVLPAAGPVCIRRGDALKVAAIRAPDAGSGTAVRWAAWAAP